MLLFVILKFSKTEGKISITRQVLILSTDKNHFRIEGVISISKKNWWKLVTFRNKALDDPQLFSDVHSFLQDFFIYFLTAPEVILSVAVLNAFQITVLQFQLYEDTALLGLENILYIKLEANSWTKSRQKS